MEAFRDLSDEFTRPVILRGVFADVPARNWTARGMADHFGENRTFISLEKNSVGMARKDNGASWNPEPRSVPAVVDNIDAGGSNYIFNANFRWPHDISMVEDLQLERLHLAPSFPSIVGGNLPEAGIIQFFMGQQRAHESNPAPGQKKRLGGSTLHAAAAPNVNIQISGVKEWTMIAPEHSHLVKPKMLDQQFAVLATGGIDDWDMYEDRWNNVPRFRGKLYPGDAILIPPWFFHEVINQPGSGTEECDCTTSGKCNGMDECTNAWQLSVALRFLHMKASLRTNWLFTMLTDLGVVGKPCPPGLRWVCAHNFGASWAEMGRWTHEFWNHTQSTAALDGGNFIKKESGEHSASEATEVTGGRFE